jgi:acetyl-CoA carboxylase carboxyl transferase subunit alpha
MIIGHQKGRDTKEKIYRNFGMPRREGYRKALRFLIDGIIPEPPGGAHRDLALMAGNVRIALREHLRPLDLLSVDELLEQRYQRLMSYGTFKEAAPTTSLQSTWQSSVAALLGKDKAGEG